jgi:hypothetical protein
MKVKFNIKNINLEPKINPVSALSFGVDVSRRNLSPYIRCLSGIWKTYALVKEYLKIILVAPKK